MLTRLSIVYGSGVWLALSAWAAIAPQLPLSAHQATGKDIDLVWAMLIGIAPALLCALGFRVGMIGHGTDAWRVSRRQLTGLALASGVLFPLSAVLLRPLFALLHRGLIPAITWSFVGSVLAGLLYRLVAARR
jgi:hypothetical protein